MRLSSALLALSVLLAGSFTGCASDEVKPQEPVQPTDEPTPYPDDPALAAPPSEGSTGEDDGATPDPAQTDGSTSDKAPAADDAAGSLTDDPFGAPQDLPKPTEDVDEAGSDVTDTMPVPDQDYGGAFDDSSQPSAPEGQVAPKVRDEGKVKRRSSSVKPSKGKVTRYVNAMLLNVRSAPRANAKVVRRLLGGARIYVEEKGAYSKIKNGQWVRSRYLSAEPTPKVTRAQVNQAWRKGGGVPKKKNLAPVETPP